MECVVLNRRARTLNFIASPATNTTDKSFMRDMPHDINGTAIVQSILAMAGHLKLRVVAEGIETAEQAHFLAEHGGPCMQGYLFCRPMALADLLERMMASRQALAGLEVVASC